MPPHADLQDYLTLAFRNALRVAESDLSRERLRERAAELAAVLAPAVTQLAMATETRLTRDVVASHAVFNRSTAP